MLNMRIDSLIASVVRQELYGKGRANNDAMYFHFDLRLGLYVEEEEYHSYRDLHLLYQVDSGYRYINVFSAVLDGRTRFRDIKNWKHEITHGSGWRDIGLFSRIYFEMADEINAMLKKDGLEEVAPKDMEQHNTAGFISDALYRWVPVRVSKDPSDHNNYRMMVEVL